ncbi:MAG: sulfotransferase [Planctomycetes bacterium]|nr:sulfotransferase [Planctomycetota bacterium]
MADAHYRNFLSWLLLKRGFERQFIVPPSPPAWAERFLSWYERRVMTIDLAGITIDRPIFLIGIHRSGTTVLQDLMCLHPHVAFINNSMPTFRHCFCAAERLRKRLRLHVRGERVLHDGVEVATDSPNEGVVFWQEWLKEDPHDLTCVRRRIEDFTPAEIEKIYTAIKKVLWCYDGKANRFFCKNPRLLPHLLLLKDLFPDAKFIHIVRDARQCANSMVKLYRLEQAQLDFIRRTGGHGVYDEKPFISFPRLPRLKEYVETYGPDSIETTARLWNDAIDEVNRVRDHLPAFCEVRFEDFVRSPRAHIERLFEFCELPPIEPENKRFWEKLRGVREPSSPSSYAHFDRITEICRENLERYGYLSDASAAKPPHAR